MRISDKRARAYLLPLYNTAERDTNDIIANAASALAVRLEKPRTEHLLSELDVRILRHAISNMPEKIEKNKKARRKTYKRRVSLA